MRRGAITFLLAGVLTTCALASGSKPYLAYWLTNRAEGVHVEYVDLILTRKPLAELQALPQPTNQPILESDAIIAVTYKCDSIWNIDHRPFKPLTGVEAVGTNSMVIQGESFSWIQADLNDVLRLLKNPMGKIRIHRILAAVVGQEMEVRILATRLEHQLAGKSAPRSFGIYLAAEPVDWGIIAYGKGDWSSIRLAESPLISETEIISYDLADHSMRLKPEALSRIPKPPVSGTPFVVVVNGERVCLGVFTTCASSMSFAVPSIIVDRRTLVTNQPADTLVVDRAYPSPSFGVGPVPRNDQRIKSTLSALHKLQSDE